MKQFKRVREWIQIPGRFTPGPRASIADVEGVLVGHCTLHDAQLGIHTGVTVICPHAGDVFAQKVPAAIYCANGYGKLAGGMQVEELGEIESLIGLTNTFSVPQVAQGLLEYHIPLLPAGKNSINVVVGETNDSALNDIRRFSVRPEHVREAIAALSQDVQEGAVGAGAGTRCFGFKGGIGTSSRLVPAPDGGLAYTVGALVQTNYNGRFTVYGRRVPCGEPLADEPQGSCMVVLATDAPLSDRQLKRLARRALVGLTNTGSYIQHGSGEFVIAFSNCPENLRGPDGPRPVPRLELPEERLDPFFEATAEAVQEAVYNSLAMACDVAGLRGSAKGFDFEEYAQCFPASMRKPGDAGAKTIGIIGGMGPMATVDLFHKIVANTPAARDSEHLRILIDNDPSVPDRTQAILHNGPSPLPALQRSARLLEDMGADLLLLPCNTAHRFYGGAQAAVRIPLLNMIGITAEACRARGYHTLGLLATTGTVRANVYSDAFAAAGLACLIPDGNGQDIVMDYIYRYKAGQAQNDLAPLLAIARGLADSGAEAVILGCTELPLILSGTDCGAPYIDPTLLLALEAIRQARTQTEQRGWTPERGRPQEIMPR